MFIVDKNGMCELIAHANLRNKTTSRGIWGYERRLKAHPGPKYRQQILY